MSTHTRFVIALPAVLALVALAGCPNDPIQHSPDLETAQAGYYEKLQDCGILGEGRTPDIETMIPPGYEETYICMMDCIRSQSCSELRSMLCYDDQSISEQCWLRCESLTFRCADGEEIPAGMQCNGEAECMDGSDELGCDGPADFVCGDGTPIPAYYVCDSEEDCADGSDEASCAGPTSFTCDDGQLVPAYSECDSYADCEDGSDEAGCAELMCN